MNIIYLISIDYGYDGQQPIAAYKNKKDAETFLRLAQQNGSSYKLEEVEFFEGGAK